MANGGGGLVTSGTSEDVTVSFFAAERVVTRRSATAVCTFEPEANGCTLATDDTKTVEFSCIGTTDGDIK